ncbi:protein MIS12 homolog [Callorhinchus milii]|nr:protein MIS12 homolog [Callorhinchus milii]XP_007906632.1 protein MIS12 homolog [Callorhinchus milii]|eukprot:gi/632979724/ref/XP_007906630.1/ PREDICTED: protein MIS12 homolog [Callorhinchus milii]
MEDILMMYETQFFGFSPQTCVLRVQCAIQDSLLDVMLVAEQVVIRKLDELPDCGITPSSVRACTKTFLQVIKSRFDVTFEKLERGLLQHILKIPANVLLPEDKVHEQYPEEQYSELQEEIAQLQQCYKAELSGKQALLDEQEEQKMVELKLEQRIHWFDGLKNMWKDNMIRDVHESLIFIEQSVQKVPDALKKIIAQCEGELSKSQAVATSKQEDECETKRKRLKIE